jgi:TRAP-type C4-dicarboxylate transport system permease small subunit
VQAVAARPDTPMAVLLRRVALWFALAGGLIASVVALNTVASIVGRALVSKPIPGDVELTQFGIALSISLCLPWCQLHSANIIVDFFTQKLSPRRQGLLDAFGALLLALMCGLLSWRTAVGAMVVREAEETSMILGLPMWWNYALLAPGLALTALVALVQAAYLLRGRALLPANP